MDQEKPDLVRTVGFSHREPFLVSKCNGIKCQIMVTVKESLTDGFTGNIEIFLLDEVRAEEEEYQFATLEKALGWVKQVFSKVEPFGPPEVLYVPEWGRPQEVDKIIRKWTDGLFGWSGKNNLTNS